MEKFEDFNFDVTKTVKPQSSKTPRITSKSLCTSSCETGFFKCVLTK